MKCIEKELSLTIDDVVEASDDATQKRHARRDFFFGPRSLAQGRHDRNMLTLCSHLVCVAKDADVNICRHTKWKEMITYFRRKKSTLVHLSPPS